MKQTWSLAETETTFNQFVDDHSKWRVYSADPFWIRRLEAIDAKLLREYDDGIGKLFEIRADQMTLRKGKRQLSEAQRAQSRKRAAELNAQKVRKVTSVVA